KAIRERIRKFADRFIFGIDFNPELVKASKMNMVMNNDGAGGLFQANSLESPAIWDPDLRKFNLVGKVDLLFTRAVYECFAYGHRSWNHPRMSWGVIWFSTVPIAPITPSTVRAAIERKPSLILENISSIGVRSGL